MSIGEFWEPPLDAIATSLANMGLTGDGITRAITRAASRNVLPRPDVLAAIAGGAAGLGGLSGYLGARRGRGGRGAFRGAAKGLGAGLGFGLLTPAAAGLGGVGGAVAGSALGGMAGSGVAALLNRLGSKGPVISPGAAASIGSLFGAAPLGAAGTVLGAFAPGYAGYKLTERALNRSDYDREKQSADAGIPELDVPESLTERALGGWRRPTVDFTDRLNPPENWSSTHKDKLDRVVMDVPGFNAWRGEAIEDHLNARLLGDALRASEASKSRSRDYADWLAAVERAAPGGLLFGGKRRVNRAIGRRKKVEDDLDKEYADSRRRADEVWTRKALESLAGGNLEPSDDVNSAGWRVPTNLMDLQNKPRSFKQLMGVVGDKKRGPVKRAAAGYATAPEGHRDVGAARGAVYGYGVPMAANIGGGIGGLGGLGLGGLLGVLLARKYGLSKPNDVALAAAAGAIPAGLLGVLGGQATGGYLGYKAIGRLLGKPPWDKSEDKAGGSADEKQATDFTIRDAPLLGGLTGLSGLKGMQFANRLFDKAYPEPDADADGYEVAKEALVRVRGRRRGD